MRRLDLTVGADASPPAAWASGRAQVVYALLCVVGTALPLTQFLPWLARHGLDLPRLLGDLFANGVSGFFGWDVIVSAVVLLVFLGLDGGGLPWSRRALVAAGTCLVGVSLGLPLFFLPRARQAAVQARASATTGR